MNHNPIIEILRLNPEEDGDIPLPRYMTSHSAGMDLSAALKENLTLQPGEIKLVSTGLAMSIPLGYEAQIRPRSGLAVKFGIGIINSPGTIDADYRGEIKVALINMGGQPYTVKRGDRIAQMIINKICQAGLKVVDRLDLTDRNTGGFGHTGVS